MKIVNGKLIYVSPDDLNMLYDNPEEFWQDVYAIGAEAFRNYLIEELVIPDHVEQIEGSAFFDMFSLKRVKLPKNLKEISYNLFDSCSELEEVIVQENVTKIDSLAFNNCTQLQKLVLPNVSLIEGNAFDFCISLNHVELPLEVNMPTGTLPTFNFKYYYKIKNENRCILSSHLPEDLTNCYDIIELEELSKGISNLDVSLLCKFPNYTQDIIKLCKKLQNANIKFPRYFVEMLCEENVLTNFVQECELNNFANEMKMTLNSKYSAYSSTTISSFLTFANALGCFSTKKVLDKNGKETNVTLSQKSCVVLRKLINSKSLDFDYIFENIVHLNLNAQTSQQFLDFISVHENNANGEKVFVNFELLKDLQRSYHGSFERIMLNFEEAKKYRTTLSNNGKPKNVSWETAFTNFIVNNRYSNVNESNRDMAKTFSEKNIAQHYFDMANNLFDKAKKENVRHHILNKPLKEENILTEIEKIKNSADLELINAKQLIDSLYEKQFTYEMLDKYDPKNAIMGAYASCCASIVNSNYGQIIAINSVLKNDLQNLVVRDINNNIVAKGIMYVSHENGYVVINDFEINEAYKKDECGTGEYSSKEGTKIDNQREMIFNAFMRGIRDFVKVYDKENETPISKVVVGNGYNRLKKQCKRYEQASKNLTVPVDYQFQDARNTQFILYDRESQNKEEMIL